MIQGGNMKKILIVIFSLLLIVTGCKENKLPQNNETIVWRLMYDINTIPKLDLSFEDTNLMKKVNANTTKKKEDSDFELNSKPDDYNVDSIKEITCKK